MGILNFSDYGISWDERVQRDIGAVSANYVVYGDRTLDTYHNADYGVGIETPLFLFEKIIGLEESDSIFKMRHLVSHLFFLACLYCGFWLIYQLFGNVWLAVIGVLLVVLNPQFYAHSFFNTKDIPFMAMFFVCFFLIFKSFRHYRYHYFILAGAAIGFLVNLRIMGIMLFGLMLFFIVTDLVAMRNNRVVQIKTWQCLMLFLLSFWAMLYFSWPYLYEKPLDKMATIFSNMSKFRWRGTVLYFGEYVKANELPWHYAIVWFGITTPILYIILGIFSTFMVTYQLLRRPLKWLNSCFDRQLAIHLVCFVFPILAVIVMNSVLYDGWRHLYFVYPAFVMIVVYGIHSITRKHWRTGVYVALVISFLVTSSHMIVHHPYQHVYFNAFINRSTPNHERLLFDLDYWGVSYRQGLEEIARRDTSRYIKVSSWKPPGKHNLKILPKADRDRIQITDHEPDYFITAYRSHPQPFPFDESQEIYRIQVQNNTILSVFKLEKGDTIPRNP